jgi:hypothetical protein
MLDDIELLVVVVQESDLIGRSEYSEIARAKSDTL